LVYGQEKLITVEQEKKLKGQLKILRDKGMSAKQIAEELNFGKFPPYEKLKPSHVYFYVKKFQLKKKIERKTEATDKRANSKFKNFYFKWKPSMPENIAENLRRNGFLLNDPMEEAK